MTEAGGPMDREAFLKSVDPGKPGDFRNTGLPLGLALAATPTESTTDSTGLVERALAILAEYTGHDRPEPAPRRLPVATRAVAPDFAAPRPMAPPPSFRSTTWSSSGGFSATERSARCPSVISTPSA